MSIYYKKLLGEKVYLSPIPMEDAEKYAMWMNDFGVTDYTGRSHTILSLESEKEWLENERKKGSCILAIVELATDEVMGTISLNSVDNINRTAILGIMIGEDKYRNKGYGTEAIKLLLDFGFNYLNLNSISLALLDVNQRALRCYQKVGFKEYGRQRQCKYVNGKMHDLIHMDILSSEFKEECIKNKNVK